MKMFARRAGYDERRELYLYDLYIEGEVKGRMGFGEETIQFFSDDPWFEEQVNAAVTGDMSMAHALKEVRRVYTAIYA